MKIFERYKSKLQNKNNENIFDVVVCGWPSSGSTLIYQILHYLKLKVRKEHGFFKDNCLSVFTIRDPRDIITSNAKRVSNKLWQQSPQKAILFELSRFINENYVDDYYKAINNYLLIIRYETFIINNLEYTIKLLSDQFKILTNTEIINDIINKSSIDNNKAIAQKFRGFEDWDKSSLIHGMHITNNGKIGAWVNEFDDEIKCEIKSKLGKLLIEIGYCEDNNW